MARFLVLAFDRNEAAQVRRIRSLVALGHEVRVAAFSRGNMAGADLGVPVIDLGRVENRRLVRRLGSIAVAVARMQRHRDVLRWADVVLARNFDLLAVAEAALRLTRGADARLVYECLDIHDLFTRRDAIGRAARAAERALMRRCALVVTSSPGFVDNYFLPVQGHRGPIALIENKLWFDGPPVPRPAAPRVTRPGDPLVLGWVGSIRCAPSLGLLCALADRLGPRVEIRIHGNVHRHALPGFDAEIGRRGNMRHYGPYTYPSGLAGIYGGCDLVWAQDLWQPGGNSRWLLPNRIYEAAWFGCPSVAVAGTETGRRIADWKLGLTIPSADADQLAAAIGGLGAADLAAMRAHLLASDDRRFRLTPEEVAAALRPALPGGAEPLSRQMPAGAGQSPAALAESRT